MKIFFVLIGLFSSWQVLCAQEIGRFSINTGNTDRIDAPVCVPLDGINYNTDNGLISLFELTKNGEKEIPCQLEPGYSAKLWFTLPGLTKKSIIREYIIKLTAKPDSTQHQAAGIVLEKDEKDLRLYLDGKPILDYRYGMTSPPDGVSPLYKRSGFIHPLWTPEGEILTRIQPPDHYHHYGVWGPWTKTSIDGREVDFWNLNSGQGTVKFDGFLSEYEGAVYGGFQALQNHIDFGAKGEDQIALNELLDVRAWNTNQGRKIWMVDYTSTINSPLRNGILMEAYRYGGGIGFRATEKWTKDNCSVLTSDNKTRADADSSFARWCIVEGESAAKEGRSGILFLSHPSNRKHPEPMRVWPLDSNEGRGDMYFEFVPIRHEDWEIFPKQNFTLKYRMIIFDGEMDASAAELYWNSFASMPTVTFKQQENRKQY
jgi:hypothetical protein